MTQSSNTIYYILFILLTLGFTVVGQEVHTCSFDHEHARLMQDEGYRKRQKLLEERVINFIAKRRQSASRSSSSYTIPVVIHIITPPGTPIGSGNNLTDEEVDKGLTLLNQSFSNTGPFQTSDGHDIGIQFCLARRTPDGQATNGITRHESDLVNDVKCNGPSTNNKSNAAIKKIVNWNCKDYLNIWLVTDLYSDGLGCSLAGFAYFPGAPCSVDGIMQESRYWTTVRGTQVTAHEVGHYLNLHHTFNGGCKNDDCTRDGDRVCDTPPDSSPSFAPCDTNSCDTDSPDLPDDNTNYMDYTSCTPLHFTLGQRERMIAGLEVGRASLLASSACLPVVDNDLSLILSLDPKCSTKLCLQANVKNVGANVVSSFQLKYNVNDGQSLFYSHDGDLAPGEIVKINLPCEEVAIGQHNVSATISQVNNTVDQYPQNSTIEKREFVVNIQLADFEIFSDRNRTKTFRNRSVGATHYLWDFGDGETSDLFHSSHTYQTEGNYTVTLKAMNECDTTVISKFIEVAKCKPGWRGYVVGLGGYQEADEDLCDIINGGVLRIPPELSNIGYYWTKFNFCSEMCTGENFSLKVRMKNWNDIGGISAYDPVISLRSTDQSAGVVMMGEQWAQNWTSISVGNTRYTNLPELVLPFQDWVTVEMKFLNDSIYFSHEGAKFFELPFNASICNIQDLHFSFKGSGAIDWIEVQDEFGNQVYFEDFNDCNSLKTTQPCEFTPMISELEEVSDCINPSYKINTSGGKKPYKYYVQSKDTFYTQHENIFENLSAGNYTIGVLNACPYQDTSFAIEIIEKLGIELISIQSTNCIHEGNISILGRGGVAPYQYKLNNQGWQENGRFTGLSSGDYTVTVKDSNGCEVSRSITIDDQESQLQIQIDSSDLKVDCTDSDTYIAFSTLGSDPYHYYSLDGGEEVSYPYYKNIAVGAHSIVSRDEYGCVSDVLTFEVLDESQHIYSEIDEEICIGSQYTVGSSIYTESGVYVDSLVSSIGCDSVIQTTLTVLPDSEEMVEQWMCKDASFDFNGMILTAPGTYTSVVKATNGCDSTVILSLKEYPENIVTNAIELCEGSTYTIGGSTYDENGSYRDTLRSVTLCDSIVLTNLNLLPHASMSQSIDLCAGESVQIGTSSYSTSGVYMDTLRAKNGCDSILTTTLSIIDVAQSEQEVKLCAGESHVVNTNEYSESGTYIDTLSASNGCDSILTTRLWIHEQSVSTIDYTICEGDTLVVENTSYTDFGEYEKVLVDANGCDSLAYIEIKKARDAYCDSLYCTVTLPNAFSPDGNGVNDYFEFPNTHIEIKSFTVYDRWGNTVFTSKEGVPIRWDGTYNNNELEQGIYLYFLTGTCRGGKAWKKVGDITILRRN